MKKVKALVILMVVLLSSALSLQAMYPAVHSASRAAAARVSRNVAPYARKAADYKKYFKSDSGFLDVMKELAEYRKRTGEDDWDDEKYSKLMNALKVLNEEEEYTRALEEEEERELEEEAEEE